MGTYSILKKAMILDIKLVNLKETLFFKST